MAGALEGADGEIAAGFSVGAAAGSLSEAAAGAGDPGWGWDEEPDGAASVGLAGTGINDIPQIGHLPGPGSWM